MSDDSSPRSRRAATSTPRCAPRSRCAAQRGAREICARRSRFRRLAAQRARRRRVARALGDSRRRLVVFAHNFDEMPRRHPRFADWRRQWSHVVQCRTDPELEAEQMPTLLLVPGVVGVRLLDPVRYRGMVSGRAADHVECREAIDALLQRSVEAFPATTLGL